MPRAFPPFCSRTRRNARSRQQASTELKRGLLRFIAVFKLVKAALLIAVGLGALKLVHKYVGGGRRWVELFRPEPNNRYIDTAREKASRLTPGKIRELGLGILFYAGLLFAEGSGLSLLKGWALRIPDRWVMSRQHFR
jgi:hypothetical protein